MASTDARPVPIKNTAFRAYFDLRLNTGALNSGAAGLDSEVSKDGGTIADCTNEATEIATSSGHYFLDLTSTEMNADSVVVQIKSSTPNAVTRSLIIYPQESGDIKVDLQSIAAAAVSTSTAQLGVNVVNFGGAAGTFASGIPQASLTTAAINSVADQVWDEATSGHRAVGSYGATQQALQDGTAQAGAAGTITLASGASSIDDFYNNAIVQVIGGTGIGQARFISDYTGSTRVATVNSNWITNPDNTSVYVVIPFSSIPGASAPTASQNADAVWQYLTSNMTTTGSIGVAIKPLRQNTAQAGGASTITLDASASATNDTFKYDIITIIAGTGLGQSRQITGYVGSSKVATVGIAWATQPSSDSVFVITPLGVDAATIAAIAAGVWNANRVDSQTAGTFGEYVNADAVRFAGSQTAATNGKSYFDGTGYTGANNVIGTVTSLTNAPTSGDLTATMKTSIGTAVAASAVASVTGNVGGNVTGSVGSVTGNVGGSVASVVGAVGSVTGNVGGNVTGSVGSVVGAVGSVTGGVGGNVTGSVGSLAAQAKADVNAEVVDGLSTDTYAEPSAVPAATASLKDKIGFMAALSRNKVTQTATTFALRNDADSGNIATATVADDGTTASMNELA